MGTSPYFSNVCLMFAWATNAFQNESTLIGKNTEEQLFPLTIEGRQKETKELLPMEVTLFDLRS